MKPQSPIVSNPYLDGLRSARRDELAGLRIAPQPRAPKYGFVVIGRSSAKKSKFNPRNWQMVTGCTGGQ